VVVQRPATGVAEEDRSERRVQRGVHGDGSDVGQIDEHADALHLAYDGAAVVVEALDGGLGGGRVGPGGVVVVGEGHVADAETGERPQHAQRGGDAVPALDADERRYPALADDALDVVGAAGDREVVGVRRGHPVDGVDLLHRRHDGLGLAQGRRHVDRPELPADPAGAQPGDVGLQFGPVLVEALDPVSEAAAQLHGQVVVPVDDRHHEDLATSRRCPRATRRTGSFASLSWALTQV
jgi:hypothetical protein